MTNLEDNLIPSEPKKLSNLSDHLSTRGLELASEVIESQYLLGFVHGWDPQFNIGREGRFKYDL